MDRLIVKYDKKITKWEEKGFRGANKLHRYAINGCLLYIAYQLYDFLYEYNNYFLKAREVTKLEDYDNDGPINKSIDDDD